MALASGTRIGSYEVTAQIGVGGMGEVYRATDTNLNRQVAVKVLPEAVASDPERLARFDREAKMLAALNHPNIAAIYGLERAGGMTALVMELVEGPTLADRIARGAVPLDEALPIAKQIAEALEAAHEQGIVHRDLKPANIKVREDGTVKVLDFGLAKAMDREGVRGQGLGVSVNASQAPTITSPALMTGAGMILGTAAYMSPEQAKGHPADRRSDVWSFGAVLYEMLTGRRAFNGDDVIDVLGAVARLEPDWTALPTDTPQTIRRLLRRCLDKDRRRRLDSARAAALDIDDAHGDPQGSVMPQRASSAMRARVPWAVAAVAALVAAALFVAWAPWQTPPQPSRMTFAVATPSTGGVGGQSMFAVSPDGTRIAQRASEEGANRLWVQSLADSSGAALPQVPDGGSNPFWSPDGGSLGFADGGKLSVVNLAGGTPRVVADVRGTGAGASWGAGGVIIFAPGDGPIYRVAEGGGRATPVTELDGASGEMSHRYPRFLPDGQHFLFLAKGSGEAGAIYVGSLASPQERHKLLDTPVGVEFAPPNTLLFLNGSTLMAQRLDMTGWRLTGEPTRVAESVYANPANGAAAVAAANTTVLIYRTGSVSADLDIAVVDRSGKAERTIGAAGEYRNMNLSPDGRQIAMFKPDGGGDIWITDLERGTSTRFTFDGSADDAPVWSPDGSRIAFISNRDGGVYDIYVKASGGTGPEELLLRTPRDKVLNDWSKDGRTLVYEEVDPQTGSDLWMLSLDGDRKPQRLLASPFNETDGALSPDGRWLAYVSNEEGPRQVYLQRFPTATRKWRVSTTNNLAAAHPRWGPDGKQLFLDQNGRLSVVNIEASGPDDVRLGEQQLLFSGLSDQPKNFAVMAGSSKFLVLLPLGRATTEASGSPLPLTVVVNWMSGLALQR